MEETINNNTKNEQMYNQNLTVQKNISPQFYSYQSTTKSLNYSLIIGMSKLPNGKSLLFTLDISPKSLLSLNCSKSTMFKCLKGIDNTDTNHDNQNVYVCV